MVTGKSLPQDKVREIFPADDITGYFIDFVRLRPRISDEIPGERLHLTCEFDISSAKEDGIIIEEVKEAVEDESGEPRKKYDTKR